MPCLSVRGVLRFHAFCSVFVLFAFSAKVSKRVGSEDDLIIINNNNTSSDHEDSFERRTDKRSSSLHSIPSSSSLLLKDEDINMMDRIQIPIIYHTPLGTKASPYVTYKPEMSPHNYVLNSRTKPLRKQNIHGFSGHQQQALLGNPGPQVFPLQNPYPTMLQHNGFNSFSSQSFQSPHYSSSSSTSPISASAEPPKHPDLLYYQNFDKLCPASKPYPVYIEKKVPITVEKRVPYPVKVPYPVHHYHYDNVEHRNINAEDLKDGTPAPPPVKDSRPPPKIGGLFTGGDKGGYKGDTKEEEEAATDDTYDENEDEYETYDHEYEKSSSREIPRHSPRPTETQRKTKQSTKRTPTPTRSRSTYRVNKRNNQQRPNETSKNHDKRSERNGSLVIKSDLKENDDINKTIESLVLPQTTTSASGLRTDNTGNIK